MAAVMSLPSILVVAHYAPDKLTGNYAVTIQSYGCLVDGSTDQRSTTVSKSVHYDILTAAATYSVACVRLEPMKVWALFPRVSTVHTFLSLRGFPL